MGINLTIFQKGLLLVALPVFFQLLFFGALFKVEWDGENAERWAVHTKEVIAQTETAYRYLLEATSYVRRLIITGQDPTLAPPFHDALRKAPEEFQKLGDLVRDNPSQQARVAEAAAKADRLGAYLREENDLIAAGRPDQAAAYVKSGKAQADLDSVRSDLDEILNEEAHLDGLRMVELNASWQRQNWLIGAGVVLSVLLALIVALQFSRDIAGRLARLAENVRRWGEKKELTRPLSGRDEIARLDAVFRDMARALREREQENEMFIYSVSHDLRSPLVNLQGFSEELSLSCQDLRSALEGAEVGDSLRESPANRGAMGLLSSAAGPARRVLEKDIPDSVHFIKTAVSRLSAIIDALLRLSRVGRVEYRIQPVDVEAAARRVVESLGGAVKGRKAEVVVGAMPPALGDPTAVEQIFANLIGNAVAYLDPARPGRVQVGALESGDGAVPAGLRTYYVKDNGLGIPKDYQELVFLAFKRLHANVAQGEGVGLALVYRMVGRLGGKIWVESTAGEGSTFFVALPAAPEGQSATAAQEQRNVRP